MLDERIGKMATELSGAEGIRIWHDQALYKPPWGNPTALHLDVPYWSFTSRQSLSLWVALDDVGPENGCLYFMPGTHKETTFENPGITENMASIFEFYPNMKDRSMVPGIMKAGTASFHNGLCVHAAGANMTPNFRRAMTCAYMPDGATFNGQRNILSKAQFEALKIGDVLDNDDQNPLLYARDGRRSPLLVR